MPPSPAPSESTPAPAAGDGWICGELDADYVGTPSSGEPSWSITLTRALVRSPAQVGAPPAEPDTNEIRQASLQAWLVLDGTQYPTRLHDLRVRTWTDHPSASPRAGRLRGTVWARLTPQTSTAPWVSPPAPEPVVQPPRPSVAVGPTERLFGCVHALFAATFLLVGLLVVLLTTGPTLVGVWSAGALVPWMFRAWLMPYTRAWPRTLSATAGLFVCAVSVGLVVLALRDADAAPCDSRSWWFVAALAVPIYLGAFLRPVWPIDLATLLWTVGIVTWGMRPDAVCLGSIETADPAAPAELRALQRGATQLQHRTAEALAPDDTARLLAATNDRLSVGEALTDPDAMCRLPIVLSATLLLASDSDVIDPARAEPHLRRLRRALSGRPAAKITVTGHVPDTRNRELDLARSQRQADSVARWLQEHANLPELVAEGLGASRPAVDDPSLAALNHRVEVVVDCG